MRQLKYPAINGLRFYAALVVLILHECGAIVFYLKIPPETVTLSSRNIWLRLFYFISDGKHGVDLFFVISGFLMARIVLLRPNFSYVSFVRDRILRIYPAFLASLVLTTMYACWFLGAYGWTFEIWRFIGNLFFLNAFPSLGVPPYNAVTWSLAYEFGFYLAIPILLFSSRPFGRVGAAIALLVCYSTVVCFLSSQRYFADGFLRAIVLFAGAVLGSCSDENLQKAAKFIPTWLAIAAFTLCNAINTLEATSALPREILLIVGIVLLFVKAVFGGGSFLTRLASVRIFQFLGTISFSIYLLQILAMNVTLFTLLAMLQIENAWMSTIAFITLSSGILLLLATASYLMFEAPYFRGGTFTRSDPFRLKAQRHTIPPTAEKGIPTSR
jgi:exopolysaccharide production protein ExoZ